MTNHTLNQTMSIEQYKAHVERRLSKYHNKRTCGYASGLEAQRAGELKLLERAREIRDLHEQSRVLLTDAEISYRPDFDYIEKGSRVRVYEDTKGVFTERFNIIVKLWPYYGPGLLRIMVRRGARIVMQKEIRGGKI